MQVGSSATFTLDGGWDEGAKAPITTVAATKTAMPIRARRSVGAFGRVGGSDMRLVRVRGTVLSTRSQLR